MQDNSSIRDGIEKTVPSGVQKQSPNGRLKNRCHLWKLLEQLNGRVNQQKKSLSRAFVKCLKIFIYLLKVRFRRACPNNVPHLYGVLRMTILARTSSQVETCSGCSR